MRDSQSKLDVSTRRSLAEGELQGDVEVLLRTTGRLSTEACRELRDQGLAMRTQVGTVISGVADAANLLRIADLPFVEQIEGPKRLFSESRTEGLIDGAEADASRTWD